MPTDRAKDWFDNWFDSPYYHILYQHRDDAEAKQFIKKLFDYLSPLASSRVLDLACGRGRHSVHIHSMGYNVTGLDLSEKSIAYAKKSEEPTLNFLVHNMRNEFGNDEYDLVLNLFTSFGYFEDEAQDLQVLKNVSKALQPGGTFVLDFMNAQREKTNLVKEETKEAKDITFHIRREVKKRLYPEAHRLPGKRKGIGIHRACARL